jgi:hypothetical protein
MDNLAALDDSYVYENPIVNAKGYSLAASAKSDDPLAITDVFYNNGTEETNFADLAKDYYSKRLKAQKTADKSLAAAIITSKEYTLLADATTLLGTQEEPIQTGSILGQIFETVNTQTLTGKYRTFSDDLVYFTNLPESKSPEPTFGSATEVTVEVPKHGGAVAITDRARQVIQGADAEYRRLISRLQERRVRSESIIVRNAIEAIAATNNQSGVDFGATTGTPAVATYNPSLLLWPAIQNFFDGQNRRFDTFLSNALPFYEYVGNYNTRGTVLTPPSSVPGNINGSIRSAPGLEGIRWFVDNLMTTLTEGYAIDSSMAGKNFRGPTRAYTVTDPDTETEKYVTKSHFDCLIVDETAIARVTGIQA